MKKLVGGVFLLSLLTLTLVQSVDGETYTSITDKNVLEQLTNLKSYINNPEMIKPVWVQLKNGDDIIVVQGQLSVVDDGEFDIDISIKGYSLTIHVEFTQATLEDSTPIDDWYIDTNDAKYLFTSDEQNISPIAEEYVESAESGTIANVLGLDEDGGLVKESRDSVVKPLYYHGISLVLTNSSNVIIGQINFAIINNSETPLTLSTFIQWYKNIVNTYDVSVTINANGFVNDSDNSNVCKNIFMLQATTLRHFFFVGNNDGTRYAKDYTFNDADTYLATWELYDNVNKLN